uniref:Stanniocalcin 2b n=1 Tax=Acanthochromis polyacanthus TaxID=80966 RepID=A0A3Q1G6J9_9TELE
LGVLSCRALKCPSSLTEKRVGEPVPAAPVGSGQPLSSHAGGEAEWSPEDADEHVADTDVDEEQVGRSPQPGEPREHQQHQEVSQEAQNQDEPEDDGRRGVTRPAQRSRAGLRHGAVAGAEVVAMLQPAYQNLRQKVDNFVTSHLSTQDWNPSINKNQMRNGLRQSVVQSGMLESGVDRIITQVVDPKMNHTFRPHIETAIHDFLSGDRKEESSSCSNSAPPEQTESQEAPSASGPKTP